MKFRTNNKPLTSFNFSSLTDIVMLLLVFFLLTSQFVVQTGVKVKLPGAQNNEQVRHNKMVVTLTEQGRIYLGAEEVGMSKLPGLLDAAAREVTDKNVIIRADKSVKIDLIIQVIDIAKGLGIDKFTIQTEKVNF
jgi:biopolymer transport protein ExbD